MSQPETADLPLSVRWFAPWRWRRRYQLLVLLLLPAYPLSIGPIVWLYEHRLISPQFLVTLETLYYPLQFAHSNSEWCRFLLDIYTEFWRDLH